MTEPTAEPPTGAPSSRAWPIAFAVVAVLLIAAVVFILLRDDGSDETATGGTSTVTSTSTTSTTADSGPSSSMSNPVDIVCTATDLRAAIDPSVLGQGAEVAEFGCTPATTGDAADAYAWARVETPGLEPLTVFFSGSAGEASGSSLVVTWRQLAAGTAVVCEEHIPVEACDMLPGAPRSGGPSESTSSAPATISDLACTAEDLTAAVEPGVLADGAQVTTFACTPSSLEDAETAYAFARFEAPDVGSIVVLYSAVALVEPGTPTIVDWQSVAYGSAIVCDEHLPSDACDQLPGVPR